MADQENESRKYKEPDTAFGQALNGIREMHAFHNKDLIGLDPRMNRTAVEQLSRMSTDYNATGYMSVKRKMRILRGATQALTTHAEMSGMSPQEAQQFGQQVHEQLHGAIDADTQQSYLEPLAVYVGNRICEIAGKPPEQVLADLENADSMREVLLLWINERNERQPY